MTADAPRRRRKWRGRVLALLLGLGVPLLVLEVAVRVVHGAPVPQRTPLLLMEANELRGWQLVPERDFYTYSAPVSVNSLGLRGPEVEPKVADELRVVALGDSMTFGMGVGDDATLPAALERELEARLDRPVSVVNAGLPAYSTNQELALLLELGEQLDPDLVVLFWFFNDMQEQPIAALHRSLVDTGPRTFQTGDAFEGWPATRWRIREALRRSAIVAWWLWHNEHHTLGRDDLGSWSQESVDAAFDGLAAWMGPFAQLPAAIGAEPAAVVLPFAASFGSAREQREHPSRRYDARALEVFAASGVPAFDARPALEAASSELGRVPYLPYDYHWDAEGNAAIARAVAEWMVERFALK